MATAAAPITTPLDIPSDQVQAQAKPQRIVGKRNRSRAVRSQSSRTAIEDDATNFGDSRSPDGNKGADNCRVKRTRSGSREGIDGDSLDDLRTSLSSAVAETPVVTSNKGDAVPCNMYHPVKKLFNGVVHQRLVAQRRLVHELKAANKQKDQALNQFKTMWAREKNKNQLLLDRLSVIEKKLIALARPLKRSIANLSRDSTACAWNAGLSSISRSPSSFSSLSNRDIAPPFTTES